MFKAEFHKCLAQFGVRHLGITLFINVCSAHLTARAVSRSPLYNFVFSTSQVSTPQRHI